MSTRTTVERQGDELVIKIPMQLKKRLGRKEIILPAGMDEEVVARPQEPLLMALARAFEWQEAIECGRYGGVGELAAALGVDRSYVRRILVLATLAPDLVEALVEGREASGLSLERLGRSIALAWEDQRERLNRA